MLKYDKEIKCGFDALLDYCFNNYDGVYTLVYPKKKIEVKFDTMWEDDNGLELEDPNYEEYNSILFINLKTGKGIPICYHNMPKEIWHNGKKIL